MRHDGYVSLGQHPVVRGNHVPWIVLVLSGHHVDLFAFFGMGLVVSAEVFRRDTPFAEHLGIPFHEFLHPSSFAHRTDPDAFYLLGGKVGEIDVVEDSVARLCVADEKSEDVGEKSLHTVEIRIRSDVVERDSDRGDTVQGAFLGGSESSGVTGCG